MTRNPDGLRTLEEYFTRNIGPFWMGTVGDDRHTFGYHLGAFETPIGDYSTQLTRDVEGIKRYGGYWASAVDIGMGWMAARDWLRWLINETNRGKFPDIREIAGSTDGKVSYRWDMPSKKVTQEQTGEHIRHAHISFFRDSIFRDHTRIFQGWTKTGRVLPPSPTTTMRVSPKPTPVVQVPVTPEDSQEFLRFSPLLAMGAGALAWIIKRRMEAAREDSL